MTSLILVLVLSLLIGIIGTFILIRKIPTLMRGSKQVVVVENGVRNVMVMPKGVSCPAKMQHSSNEPSSSEHPAYLTPLPTRKTSEVNQSKYEKIKHDDELFFEKMHFTLFFKVKYSS